MGQTNDPWPPTPWRWPPDAHHLPAVAIRVFQLADRLVPRRGLPPDYGEDLAQEIMLELHVAVAGPAPPRCESYDEFRKLCRRLASKVSHRFVRSRGSGKVGPLDFEPADARPAPEHGALEAILTELDEPMRPVVRAMAVDGMSYRDIARHLGLPPNRVATLAKKAKSRLRRRGYGPPPAEEAS